MEIRDEQRVMFRGRGLKTNLAVIPTQHGIPATSYSYSQGPGQTCAIEFMEVEKSLILILRLFSRIAAENSSS